MENNDQLRHERDNMKSLKRAALVVLMFLAPGLVYADAVQPDQLIRNTVDEVIAIIKKDKDIQAGDPKKIVALVDEKVLPHFDFTRMTRLAVGKYWRAATPQQRDVLVTEFRNLLVRTYTKVFTVYRNQTVDIKPFRMAAGDTEVTVKTVINKPGSEPVPVDYEMEKIGDDWKVFDISIEGVSMVMSYRGTFASEVESGGIDGLIKTLTAKNAAPAADDIVKTGTK